MLLLFFFQLYLNIFWCSRFCNYWSIWSSRGGRNEDAPLDLNIRIILPPVAVLVIFSLFIGQWSKFLDLLRFFGFPLRHPPYHKQIDPHDGNHPHRWRQGFDFIKIKLKTMWDPHLHTSTFAPEIALPNYSPHLACLEKRSLKSEGLTK